MNSFCRVIWLDKSKPIKDRLAAGFSLEYAISYDLQRILAQSCCSYAKALCNMKIVDFDDHVLVYVPESCFFDEF